MLWQIRHLPAAFSSSEIAKLITQPWSTSPSSTCDLQVPQAPPRQLCGRPMPAASPASRISSPAGHVEALAGVGDRHPAGRRRRLPAPSAAPAGGASAPPGWAGPDGRPLGRDGRCGGKGRRGGGAGLERARSDRGRRRGGGARRGAPRARARAQRSTVLEAKDRIGGRAWTDTTSLGIPWERGANWLHDAERNLFRRYADEAGFAYERAPPERRLWQRRAVRSRVARGARRLRRGGLRRGQGGRRRRAGHPRRPGDPAAIRALARLFAPWFAALNGIEAERMSTLDFARAALDGGNWRVEARLWRPARALRPERPGRARDAGAPHRVGRAQGAGRHRARPASRPPPRS